jgi:hypothetical protein
VARERSLYRPCLVQFHGKFVSMMADGLSNFPYAIEIFDGRTGNVIGTTLQPSL